MAHVLLRGDARGISTIREQAALNLSERTHMNKTTPFPTLVIHVANSQHVNSLLSFSPSRCSLCWRRA